MRDVFDITGKKFGYWTVLRRDEEKQNSRNSYWICKCVCGKVRSITRSTLISGKSKSCGCVVFSKKGINSTHGMSKDRLYNIWANMRKRCFNQNDQAWERYGGRGITVCDEWKNNFVNFMEWAYKNGYSESLTIDRIDVNGNYEPSNCRWITRGEQQANRTNTVWVVYNGEEKCLRSLCQEVGFPYKTAYRRLQRLECRGEEITVDKLLAPIQEKKISYKYRH